MKTVKTSWSFESPVDGWEILRLIERAGRTCYKSEDLITMRSAEAFAKKITHQLKHHSVLEHVSLSVRVVCDRGISHEIVRHRIGAYSQESTRYCNYSKDKHGNGITIIEPEHLRTKPEADQAIWHHHFRTTEATYLDLIGRGWTPQEARGILGTELKTELVITYNLRQWRHFFTMRCAKAAHPQMRTLALPMLAEFKTRIPVVFDDLEFTP